MKLHMAARSRFSTSTVIDSEYLVPWLSAEGPLAYSPTKPPARDYFFQYTWILPGIFNPQVNLREHRYFGSPLKDRARFLFDFWANAHRGNGPALHRQQNDRAAGFTVISTSRSSRGRKCISRSVEKPDNRPRKRREILG